MLSYRHGFHAGNSADVLKHLILCAVISYIRKKDKPFTIIDTHAGGGIYRLDDGMAEKTGEAKDGIVKLMQHPGKLPEIVPEYFSIIRDLNPEGKIAVYPGSPYIEQQLLRDSDKGIFIELHPTEFDALRLNFGRDRRISLHRRDSFEGLDAIVPPPVRRGAVLMDPAYEVDTDYAKSVSSIGEAFRKCPTMTMMLWYPVLSKSRDRSQKILSEARRLAIPDTWRAEICTSEQEEDFGMCGSGMIIFNCPFSVDRKIGEILSCLEVSIGMGRNSSVLTRLSEKGC